METVTGMRDVGRFAPKKPAFPLYKQSRRPIIIIVVVGKEIHTVLVVGDKN